MSSSKNKNKSTLKEKKSVKLKGASQKSSKGVWSKGKRSASKSKSVKRSGPKWMKVNAVDEKSSKSRKRAISNSSKSAGSKSAQSKQSSILSKTVSGKSKTSNAWNASSKASSSPSTLQNSKFCLAKSVKVQKIKIKSKQKEVSKSYSKETSAKSESSKKSSRSVSVSSKSGSSSSSSSSSKGPKFKSKKRDSRMYRCVESYQEDAEKIVDFYGFLGEPITLIDNSDHLDKVIDVAYNMADTVPQAPAPLEESLSPPVMPSPIAAVPPCASPTRLGNVISLPILPETPSRLESVIMQGKAKLGEAAASLTTAGNVPERTAGSLTDAPMLNHVLSAESLIEGHCGSAALRPQAQFSKWQIISARYLIDSSVQPIGVLLGSIHSWLNSCLEPTGVLVRAALVSTGDAGDSSRMLENDVALDICQVDELDSKQVSKVFQVETKPNLITVTPSEKGRVLFYDQTGRGMQLLPGSLLKLDGERIALWVAHVGQQTPADTGPTSRLKVLKVERPTRGTWVKSKQGEQSRSHKVEVTSGTATLLLWRTGPSAQAHEITERSAASPLDLMLVVEDLCTCAGIAIDELLLWDERMHQAKVVEQARLDVAQVKKGDCLAEGNFPALTFASAQVVDCCMEYLIFGSSRITAGLMTIGVLTGTIAGFLYSPSVTLKGISGDSLHLHLAFTDIHNRSLMQLRRRVFHLPEAARLRVIVGGNAVVNLCGDQGGGWILSPGTVFTLSCTRLIQLNRCTRSRPAPVKLETATEAVTVEDRRLVINTGEATFLVTDNAKTIAFYIH